MKRQPPYSLNSILCVERHYLTKIYYSMEIVEYLRYSLANPMKVECDVLDKHCVYRKTFQGNIFRNELKSLFSTCREHNLVVAYSLKVV